MDYSIELKSNDIFALMFIYCTSAFYVLKDSHLKFPEMKYLVIFSVICGLFYIFKEYEIRSRYKWLLILFGVIIVLTTLKIRDSRLAISYLAILVGIKLEEDKMVENLFYSRLCFFILAMITGGVGHINGVAINAGVLLLLYIVKQKNSAFIVDKLVIIFVYIIAALYTKSGSLIICGGIAISFFLLSNLNYIKKIMTSKITMYIYPIVLGINVLLCVLISNRYFTWIRIIFPNIDVFNGIFLTKIDQFTSWRLTLGGESLHRYGISLLGGNVNFDLINENETVYFNLDSGMLWLLQGWGILITVLFMILITIMMKRFIKKEKYYYIIASVCIALWAMNEDILVSIGGNFMFFFLGKSLIDMDYNKNINIKEFISHILDFKKIRM